ncbi:ankyrin repeat-containing domain protein [Ephemerocybe angulata]|uniref:Ankyrin repeat-containing domain protein n=1 Tax=Ephemerocybe angulata TaxID=980116 RepID=A0A8H6IB29_9AGAR|nr:ankyrin repeat-containing domain protein [Tulosesus angulatus]
MSAMRMSCKLEDLKIIRFLLEAGADPNIEGGDRRDPYTIERRNKDSLRLLNQVEKGSLDPAKALVQAAKNGYGAAIKIILSFLEINLDEKEKFLEAFSGININAGNTDWMASPAVAVTKAQEFETAILKLLASPGIDVNAPCTSGETPLSFAAGRGHEGVVKLLLAAPGINVNAPDAQGPLTFERSCQARYQVVNGYEVDMFKPGFTSYVDRPDAQGQTPLILAAQGGHEANVKLLLAAPGINVSVAPLSIAARGGHEAVVKLLLAMPGIDVNGPDKKGRTPLSFAAENGHEGVFKLLLAVPGINVHTSDVEGRTPLSFAARGGPGPGGWRVRPHNTPDRDWDEWIPLILEATDGHEAIVKHLLAVPEIPVNAPARDGWTPLMFAAKQGNEAIVKLLLAAPGIDINATDTSGWSASIWAAFQGNTAVVEALCVVPELIVDVADVKRRLKNPPKGWRWSCRNPGPEDDLRQEKCVRILENFVESKGGGAQDGAEKPGGG